MSGIDWSTGNYFLEVLQDLGSGYVTIGTSQMLSVPYSLYAESANVQTDNTISGNGQLSSPIGISQQGAEPGEVLMWNGAAWIPDSLDIVFPSGQCQTLDQSYDCDTPGAGRTINADNGAVHIIALGNDGLEITGIGAAESGVSANIEGAGGTGFRANLIDGVGTGLYVGISSEGSKGIYVEHNANSQGMYMHSSAPGAGIEIEKDNTATGNSILTQNLNSSDNAVSIEALQLGTGHAIQGVSGQTPALFAHETGETSGVSGIAFMQGPAENGVAGISGNGDGVWGFTHRPVNIDG
ncbi:MAG: hypothetical protein JNM00_11200, partial [Flavobacteriales bacterium]|nr:hypothetical protein [Flavobacteriales bacterium]